MALFETFKRGLKKTRDFIGSRINRIAASIGIFDEEMLDDLETVLIQADCGVKVAIELTEAIRADIKKTGDNSYEYVVGVLADEMKRRLRTEKLQPERGKLNVILMVGVNGTGKTTTTGKLAKRFKDEQMKVLIGAADTFRAAAVDQLKVWGERAGVAVIAHAPGADPAAVVYDALQAAKARGTDVLLLDTAGRLHNKKNLMDELAKMHRIIGREAPEANVRSLLVLDATTGQNAVSQAKAFAEVTDVDGLVLAKLDGNAKGGVAFAVVEEVDVPLVLAGLGEGIDDLVDFDASLFVNQLLPDRKEDV
jgi:fused signal recognition particle receptor